MKSFKEYISEGLNMGRLSIKDLPIVIKNYEKMINKSMREKMNSGAKAALAEKAVAKEIFDGAMFIIADKKLEYKITYNENHIKNNEMLIIKIRQTQSNQKQTVKSGLTNVFESMGWK